MYWVASEACRSAAFFELLINNVDYTAVPRDRTIVGECYSRHTRRSDAGGFVEVRFQHRDDNIKSGEFDAQDYARARQLALDTGRRAIFTHCLTEEFFAWARAQGDCIVTVSQGSMPILFWQRESYFAGGDAEELSNRYRNTVKLIHQEKRAGDLHFMNHEFLFYENSHKLAIQIPEIDPDLAAHSIQNYVQDNLLMIKDWTTIDQALELTYKRIL